MGQAKSAAIAAQILTHQELAGNEHNQARLCRAGRLSIERGDTVLDLSERESLESPRQSTLVAMKR
jgi:hypothetical protein